MLYIHHTCFNYLETTGGWDREEHATVCVWPMGNCAQADDEGADIREKWENHSLQHFLKFPKELVPFTSQCQCYYGNTSKGLLDLNPL